MDETVDERQPLNPLPEARSGAFDPVSPGPSSDAHPGISALANLFLVLFLWVAGSGLAVFLGQELAAKGYFSGPNPGTSTNDGPLSVQGKKVSKLLATGAATLLVFPAQLLLLVALMRHPATGCPNHPFQPERSAPLGVLGIGLAAVGASHVAWMGLGFCLNRVFLQEPEIHPLSTLLQNGGRWGMVLVALQGCLVAPVMEEALCRGYLMTLLATMQAGIRSLVGVVVSLLLLGFALDLGKFQGLYGWFNGGLLAGLLVLPVVTVWLAPVPDQNNRAVWCGIIAQAQIFSCLHASTWPAPVALMSLAFGLGWMRASGQPLVACVVVHALFNLVSLLMAGWLTPG